MDLKDIGALIKISAQKEFDSKYDVKKFLGWNRSDYIKKVNELIEWEVLVPNGTKLIVDKDKIVEKLHREIDIKEGLIIIISNKKFKDALLIG